MTKEETILTVDAGNTSLKLGIFKGDDFTLLGEIKSGELSKIYLTLQDVFFESLVISSVISIPTHITKYLTAKAYKSVFLSDDCVFPVKFKQENGLGMDRKVLASGGVATHPQTNLLIISIGTCITYNLINNKQEFLGGSISPGVALRLGAMHEKTHLLPLINPNEYAILHQDVVFGGNTKESMLSGVMNGILGEIDFFIAQADKSLKGCKVIITGTHSEYFSDKRVERVISDKNLLMKGLKYLYQIN